MTLEPSLMKAILSMDSYNRGYDQGIELKTVLNTTKIGDATIRMQSETDTSSEGVRIGFYALAYEYNGETIISYRGTDYPDHEIRRVA